MAPELSKPSSGRFVCSPKEVLGAKTKSGFSGNIAVIKAIIDSTTSDLPSLLLGLKDECARDADLRITWTAAVEWYQRNPNSRGLYDQPEVPKEYHYALITYVLVGFYNKFNEATRTLKSPSEVSKYPYRHFFKLLLLAVVHVKGHPYQIPKDLLLYRGMSGHFHAEKGSFITFQHFTSTTRNLNVAVGYAGRPNTPRTVFIIHGIGPSGVDAGRQLGTTGCPNAICLDHIAPDNEECLIWPCETFQVTLVLDHPDHLREIRLQA